VTVVGGFPFIMPEYKSMVVYMPYMDFVQDKIFYQGIADPVWFMQTQGDDMQAKLAMWSWINKLNPDWRYTKNTQATAFGPVDLSGGGSLNGIAELDIDVVVGETVPNRWYGTADVAKFGVVAFTKKGKAIMPLRYINLAHCTIVNDDPSADGFVYALVPGVSALFTAYSVENSAANPSSVPPIYYYAPQMPIFNGFGARDSDDVSAVTLLGYAP